MRILQILPELNVGGVETGTIDFARYLKEKGIYNVIVSRGGELVSQLEEMGVKHYGLPVHKKSPFTFLRCIRALRDIILQEKIDVVHARSRVPAWIAYFACRRTDAAFITTCHGYYSLHFFSRVMGWPKRVIVPSDIIGRHMTHNFRVPAENIRCVPRGVDLSRFALHRREVQGQSHYTIVNIGRLTPLKGHVFFLRAMAKVVRNLPYVRIWIIGEASPKRRSYRHDLEMLVKQLGLTDHVTFMGNRQDVPQLLSEADVLVMGSIKPESFGRVIIEAQAAGVPVVATNVGGFAEIIDHEKTGLLVAPRDSDDMAHAVVRVLNERKFARQLAQNAEKKVHDEFTVATMSQRTLEVYDELLKSQHILVIKISSLGDVILVTPSLKALRSKFPKARISCLVGKESRQILQRCPYINELIVIDSKDKEKRWWSLLKFSRHLRARRFDKVIDFQNNSRSHWLAFLSFPRESYGFRNHKWGFLLSQSVACPRTDYAPVEHQFLILESLGIKFRKDVALELWPSTKDLQNAQRLLESEWISERTQIVGFHLQASEKWATKNWPIEHMARVCDYLATRNIRVVLTGSPRDKPEAKRLMSMTKTRPINLVGRTDIMGLVAIIKKCHVYLTPDSAPLHIAAAVKTPFIVFFGPTASQRHLPPAERYLVFEKQLACAPCYRPRCRILTHACMKDITPEEVIRGIEQLLPISS